jgi:SAM-dependent methyltransferase
MDNSGTSPPAAADAERWDHRYRDHDTPWDTGYPSTELQRSLAERKLPPCRALEVGCGTGTNLIWLAQEGFDCTGIDLSPRAIEQARLKATAAGVNVRLVIGDVCAPPDLGEPFEFVFDRGCYHAVRRNDVAPFLRAMESWTAPGAQGLVITGNAKSDRKNGPPVVTEEEIRAELGSVFKFVMLREFWLDEPPGSREKWLGWSCWVRKG